MEAPAVLYHYASLDTLALILHNRTIRFSRLDKVDDPQNSVQQTLKILEK